ncbi:GAP family protein [Gimesia fumaroli]|uniref:Cytochrome C biogenesis protein transmembrane region n=1 Tax=Gimesia fumaroli TaxID=2527976 RepID=A0A518I6M1_9PLAN|nr:GAP family protein [Gimesia fumaroli]QDV48718.1 Cytochrome C biogenesis protein transmembrane region [Gimesia fumaroli]
MFELWMTLIPVLIADVVNPVLFAFLVYAAGTNRPVVNSCGVLLGHTLAYYVAGVVIAIGIESISNRLSNPQQIDYIIGMVIGLILLWVGFLSWKTEKTEQAEESCTLTPMSAVGLGAIVNFMGLPFALPYFAALDQILKADLTPLTSLAVLAGYNVLYALPFALVPILTATSGEKSQIILRKINDWLVRISNFLMPILLVLVGLALIVDSMIYFVTGYEMF